MVHMSRYVNKVYKSSSTAGSPYLTLLVCLKFLALLVRSTHVAM